MSVHTIDEIPAKAFVKKLADRGMYQNWSLFLLCSKSNFSCLTMLAKISCLVVFFFCFYLFLVLLTILLMMPQDFLLSMNLVLMRSCISCV